MRLGVVKAEKGDDGMFMQTEGAVGYLYSEKKGFNITTQWHLIILKPLGTDYSRYFSSLREAST